MPPHWHVEFVNEFNAEFGILPSSVREGIASTANLLQRLGPNMGRPLVDTLHGSRHHNMKEVRLATNAGAWRVAFAFDPARRAVVLVAGNKSGIPSRQFYRRLIRTADIRYDRHLATLASQGPKR